jgi:hypothetical protein
MAEKDVNKVSRQGVAPDILEAAASEGGIQFAPTNVELKDANDKVVKTVNFVKLDFNGGEGTSDEKFERAVALLEALYPPVTNDGGEVERQNSPLDILLAHLTSSFDLTMRGYIRSKEAAILEGPDKAIAAAAKKLSNQRGLSIEEATRRVKIAWGVE